MAAADAAFCLWSDCDALDDVMKELPVTSTKDADEAEFEEEADAVDLLEEEERRPLIDKLFPAKRK